MDNSIDHGGLGTVKENGEVGFTRNRTTSVRRCRIKAVRREIVSRKQMILAVFKGFLFPENGLRPNNKVHVIGQLSMCNRSSLGLLSFCGGDS